MKSGKRDSIMGNGKRLISRVGTIPADLAIRILKLYANRNVFYDNILRKGMKEWEKRSSYFISFNLRPKRADNLVSIEKGRADYHDTAIIIQGPLVKEEDFTCETVRFYQKIFPKAPIIISCWEEDRETLGTPENFGGGYFAFLILNLTIPALAT